MPARRGGARAPPRRRGADHLRAGLPHLAERLPAGRGDGQRRPRAPVPRGPPAPRARVRPLRGLALCHAAHVLRRGRVGAAARPADAAPGRVDPRPRRRSRRLPLLHVPLPPDDARPAAGRPQGRPRADRSRRAADLPRPLPEPVPDPARADLPGGGGAGLRRGALPHGASSVRGDRRGDRPGHGRRRGAVPAPARARGPLLPLRRPGRRREGLPGARRRVPRLARAGRPSRSRWSSWERSR